MAALTCDICGGQLSMDPSGDFAVCENCGMKHTKDRIKTKAQEITGTIKIDDSDAIKEQISNWEKMAGDAFNNKNYSEAYTYYCKILERDTGYWLATYRKGLCIGWQGNLKDMHINEVLGGIVDASKLLYEDEMQTASLKANGVLLMATEVYNWINSINTALSHSELTHITECHGIGQDSILFIAETEVLKPGTQFKLYRLKPDNPSITLLKQIKQHLCHVYAPSFLSDILRVAELNRMGE